MSGTTPTICAVIPALDEATSIETVVRGAREHCDSVIVVDDGSRDDTALRAHTAGAEVLTLERRRGKGAAIRAGIRRALAHDDLDAILLLDADGQHAPCEIPRLKRAFAEGAEFVVGDRSAEFAHMSFVRRSTNRIMTALLCRFFLSHGPVVRDTQCGFRLLSIRTCRALRLQSTGFDIESEMLVAATRHGLDIASVRVSVIERRGRSKIRVVPDTWRFLSLLARLARSRRDQRADSVRVSVGDLHG
jgi:glycosyltransferase involved in cell wall biosynthesis